MNGQWKITREISVGIIIEVIVLLTAAIGFAMHIDHRLTEIEGSINYHINRKEIHQNLMEKELLFPRRSEFEELKKKVEKLEGK